MLILTPNVAARTDVGVPSRTKWKMDHGVMSLKPNSQVRFRHEKLMPEASRRPKIMRGLHYIRVTAQKWKLLLIDGFSPTLRYDATEFRNNPTHDRSSD